MDLILGQFCDGEIARLSLFDLDELEIIMNEEDKDLIAWITGEQPLPPRYETALFARIAAIRPDFDRPCFIGETS